MFSGRTGWNAEPNRFTLALERHRASGTELLDLTASNPTECGFRYETAKILESLALPAAMQYAPEAKGLLEARQAVVRYYAELPVPIVVAAENVLLATSTSEAYSFLFRLLCDPDDEVLIAQPSYPLFDLLAAIQDVKLVPYPLIYDHGWQMDIQALEAAITRRTRAVIVVHPNNPTGSFASAMEMQALERICAERKLAVIADEVFLEYAQQAPAPSFAGQDEALTFTLSGLSKVAGLPQMKVAWMLVNGPKETVADAMERLEMISDTYLSMNAPVQHALPALLETRHGLQTQLQKRVRDNLHELDRQLAQQQVCSRLDLKGGWYAILRVPVTLNDEDLAIALMDEAKVIVQPGHFFDFRKEGFLVVSLITPEQQFAEGIRSVISLLGSSV